MLAIGYARVSTDKQSRDGLSLGAQENAIKHYCDLYQIPLSEILIDRGVSAKSIKGRPAMESLINKIANPDIDAVVVYKIDRMFRSIRDALATFDNFKHHGVQFHSVLEKWDTSTAMGEFAMNMLLSIAQLERRQTSERTSFTLREKKQTNNRGNSIMAFRTDNKILSVGRAPYGWQWKNKELVEHQAEMAIVKIILRMDQTGKNTGQILNFLKGEKIKNRLGKNWHRKQIHRIKEAKYY